MPRGNKEQSVIDKENQIKHATARVNQISLNNEELPQIRRSSRLSGKTTKSETNEVKPRNPLHDINTKDKPVQNSDNNEATVIGQRRSTRAHTTTQTEFSADVKAPLRRITRRKTPCPSAADNVKTAKTIPKRSKNIKKSTKRAMTTSGSEDGHQSAEPHEQQDAATDETPKESSAAKTEAAVGEDKTEDEDDETYPTKKPKLANPVNGILGTAAVEVDATKDAEDPEEPQIGTPPPSLAAGVVVEDQNSAPKASPSSSRPSREPIVSPTLSEHLHVVLSNLYLNVSRRLRLPYPPRCAEDLAFCHRHHYRAAVPQRPTHAQMKSLQCALEQQSYDVFLSMTTEMCHRREFPGEAIFMQIFELFLSINPRGLRHENLRHAYIHCADLFSLLVSTFPPCWLSMRTFYVQFLKHVPAETKIAVKSKQIIPKASKLFEFLLDLLENTIERCTVEELRRLHTTKIIESKFSGASTTTAGEMTLAGSQESMSVSNSELFHQLDWEKQIVRQQTFEALRGEERLERLFVVLRLLLQILENDMVMWMLHQYKSTVDWMFCPENSPLCAVMFELPRYMRLSPTVRRLFALFGLAVSKELHRSRLKVLERYIALLMMTSNTADMENTVIGVKYPSLGSETRSLIREFFLVFKKHNTSKVSAYLNTIALLRIPFVRYEFIDHFLQFFALPRTEALNPAKIALDIAKKRWAKNPSAVELERTSAEENLSREQYLHLLLTALQAYCEWHGTRQFFTLITRRQRKEGLEEGGDNENNANNDDASLAIFRTTTDSVHRFPVQGNSVLLLEKMAEDVQKLEEKLKLSVRMSKPKIDLPLAEICIDKPLIAKYRSDLTHLVNLHERIVRQAVAHPDVDFSAWRAYLQHFVPV